MVVEQKFLGIHNFSFSPLKVQKEEKLEKRGFRIQQMQREIEKKKSLSIVVKRLTKAQIKHWTQPSKFPKSSKPIKKEIKEEKPWHKESSKVST